MIRKFLAGALALGLVAGLAGGTAYVAHAQADAIKARKDNRQEVRQAMGAVKKVIDDKGNAADVTPIALRIVELEKQFVTLFPAGSDSGDTKAAAAIWSDRAGFEAASKAMETAGGALAEASRSGDLTKVAAAFGEVGKTCGACHDKYRR